MPLEDMFAMGKKKGGSVKGGECGKCPKCGRKMHMQANGMCLCPFCAEEHPPLGKKG